MLIRNSSPEFGGKTKGSMVLVSRVSQTQSTDSTDGDISIAKETKQSDSSCKLQHRQQFLQWPPFAWTTVRCG